MNDKITIQRLASLMATSSQFKKKNCEDFIRELCNIISETLEAGENIKIKGFGTFKLLSVEARKSVNVSTGESFEIPAHHKISFTPAKELAAIVNSPFDFFEATVIDDNIDSQQLEKAADNDDLITSPPELGLLEKSTDAVQEDSAPKERVSEKGTATSTKVETSEIPTIPDAAVITDTDSAQQDLNNNPETVSLSNSAMPPEQVVEAQNNETLDNETHDNFAKEEEHAKADSIEPSTSARRKLIGRGFMGGFLSAIALIAIIFTCVYLLDSNMLLKHNSNILVTDDSSHPAALNDNPVSNTTDSVVTQDTSIIKHIEAVEDNDNDMASDKEKATAPTQQSDAPVYDTITKTRYLTTMARQHYGNYHLWPYIYEENKKILGHPDRIRPGTKVVIPDLKKYGVDPNNPADIAKAKKMGVAIYAKYK